MKRFKLLLYAALLLSMMAAVLVCFSPYAPVVQQAVPIEALWAIEDEREESETPLVTALECNGVPLAYDAQENTFYCTIGLDNGETWPEIHLTAPGARGVSLVFEDDYTYDWCHDAVRDNAEYWAMAYTDTAFSYFRIVFTGLPLVMIETAGEITPEDTPAQVTVSAYGSQPIVSKANVHIRGASSISREKSNLKVDFIRNASGKKNWVTLPGIGLSRDVILNGMGTDELLMRENLSWAIYDQLLGEAYSGAMDARRTQYAELFVNGEYRGLYLMTEPIHPEDELTKASESAALTDSLYMTMVTFFVGERPYLVNEADRDIVFELRYAPAGQAEFAGIEPYVALSMEQDDAVFVQKAEALLDMDSILRYGILCQAGGFADNVHNNMYIWAHQTAGGLNYRFAPWDMDMTWGERPEMHGINNDHWVAFPLLDRVLLLDVANARQRYADMWTQLRQDVLSVENIAQLLADFSAEMSDSGALLRNAMRWDLPMDDTSGIEISSFAQMHLLAVDQAVTMLLTEEAPSFLRPDWSIEEGVYPPIFPEEQE